MKQINVRTTELENMHIDCFNGRTDYIPLLINVSSKENKPYTEYECMLSPQKAIERYLANHREDLKVKCDRVPVIESNFVVNLIPSIFGGKTYESPGGYIDIRPFLSDISKVEDIHVDDIFNGEMEHAIKHLQYLMDNTPDDIYVNMSRMLSPLDAAVIMRGGAFYEDLALETELALAFMEKITDVTCKVIDYFKQMLNQPQNRYVTLRGLYFDGIRLTGDSIVNLSPNYIIRYMSPIYKKFEEKYGSVMLHYCCLPASSTHVLPALIEGGGVKACDNWQGYNTMLSSKYITQDKISICTDVSYDEIKDIESFLSRSIFKEVKRNGGRGIVVTTTAVDVDSANRLYEQWRNKFQIKV